MTVRAWTGDQDAIIRECYANGWPIEWAAKKLGADFTRQIVARRARMLDLVHLRHIKEGKNVTMPGRAG